MSRGAIAPPALPDAIEMSMEDLVNELVSLQAELRAEEDETNGDGIVIKLRLAITDLEKQLEVANAELSNELRYYTTTCNMIKTAIEETKVQIIDAWDGEKRTVRYDAGLLKFRTTKSLKIKDGQIFVHQYRR
jgi:hypothetical protein